MVCQLSSPWDNQNYKKFKKYVCISCQCNSQRELSLESHHHVMEKEGLIPDRARNLLPWPSCQSDCGPHLTVYPVGTGRLPFK